MFAGLFQEVSALEYFFLICTPVPVRQLYLLQEMWDGGLFQVSSRI